MKTRTYLMLMLAAILIPVASLSLLGLSMLLQSERASRLHAIREIARSTSQLIDSEIAIAAAPLRNAAYSQDIRNDDFERLHRLFSATRTSPMSWTMIADYAGNGLMNTLVPYGTPLSKNTGKWAADIFDAQQTRVTGYFLGSLSKRGVVSVSVPVPITAGKRYVVSQIFDPDYFNRIFRQTASAPGWVVGVSDARGITIARNMNAERLVGQRVRQELYDASHRQSSGLIRHPTREGIDVYDTFIRSDLTGWTVAIGVPVGEIESAARMTTLYAAIALVTVLGAAVGMAVFFGRRIDQSLGDATLAAQALAEGRVAAPSRSRLQEVDLLLGVLHQSGLALAQESQARLALQSERETLLRKERDARMQAEAQNDAKDNFISMLSHELRNPLAAITSAIAVARLPNVPPARAEKAWEIVMRQLRHLTRMIEDLLDVRRVLSGRVTLDRTRLNAGEVLGFCCDARRMGASGGRTWTVCTEDAWLDADRNRLEQIIDNLLVNAVKYTPDDGSITVRNYTDGGMAVIEVSDTGAGIAADVMPTIFDSLVQGPTTIDRSQGGLGLGLSIAKGLVHMHGGTIAAHSPGLGMGSTFIVRLHLPRAENG